MTPEEFVKDYTSHCSNAVQGYDDMQNPVIEYHPLLTPEQALRAVEIAREEMIDKAYIYINYQLNLPNDFEQHFRKAMKKLILSALATIIMVGCIEHKGTAIKDANNYTWEVVTIDSCEYIVDYGKYSNGTSHKGNCKYCQQRMRQMMWEVQDSILNTMD